MFNPLFILRKFFVEMGIMSIEETENDYPNNKICPICECEYNEICNTCEIDPDTLFGCPLLNEESLKVDIKRCNVDNDLCPYKGTDYEICDKYHNNLDE